MGCAKASNPITIEKISVMSVEGVFETVGIPQDMLITNSFVILAEDQAGFSIFNKDNTELKVRKYSHSAYDEFSNIRQLGYDKRDNILFVFDRYGPPTIYSFNIDNPEDPSFLDRITAGDIQSIYEFFVKSDETDESVFVAITTTNSTFRVGTIPPPYVNMQLTNNYMPNAVKKFHIINNYAYIAASQRGLYIFDIESRELLSELNLTGDALDVKVQGDYAYVVTKQEGLQVVDISDRSNPIWLKDSAKSTVGWAQSIDVDGTNLVVGSGGGGVYLFDIGENPAAPKLLDRLTTSDVDYTLLVAIEGDTIYAAGKYKGVSKIKISR